MSSDTEWQKSAKSGQTGSCVEMRRSAGAILVRDSKADGQGPILSLGREQAEAWITAARNGELDHLV